MIYELANGNFLVISNAGVRTIVYRKPYSLSGGVSLVQSLRTIADTIEEAMAATGPLERSGVCGPG